MTPALLFCRGEESGSKLKLNRGQWKKKKIKICGLINLSSLENNAALENPSHAVVARYSQSEGR